MRKMISLEGKVDFECLACCQTVLFVSTLAVNTALHCFINIFYAQAFKTLFEYAESLPSGRLPVPVHVLCNDFAAGDRIQDFPEYINPFYLLCCHCLNLKNSSSKYINRQMHVSTSACYKIKE